MINLEALEARLKELLEQKERLIASLQVVDGAAQECLRWIVEHRKPDPEKPPEVPHNGG